MLRKRFKTILSEIASLTHNQRHKLLSELTNSTELESINVIESQSESAKSCPYCESLRLLRWGKSHGLQRFRCKECDKTFNALTGSSLSRLRHKELWLTYSKCLIEGKTIRKAAKECGIDKTTSFRWRHRFLATPSEDKAEKMVGIVEADETFFTASSKGERHITGRKPRKRGRSSKKHVVERVPVLIVRDRTGTEADFVFEKIEKEAMHNCMRPLMGDEVVLCTDGNNIYTTFSKAENIPHKRIIGLDGKYVVDEIFHIQNLNGYISRLKNWMTRFNGVATKYLENYLGWRRMLERSKTELSNKEFLQRAIGRRHQQLMQT